MWIGVRIATGRLRHLDRHLEEAVQRVGGIFPIAAVYEIGAAPDLVVALALEVGLPADGQIRANRRRELVGRRFRIQPRHMALLDREARIIRRLLFKSLLRLHGTAVLIGNTVIMIGRPTNRSA